MIKRIIQFLICMTSAQMALADDQEIYFAQNKNNTIKSNVLFVLDTSGSMAWPVVAYDENETYVAPDGSSVNRSSYYRITTNNDGSKNFIEMAFHESCNNNLNNVNRDGNRSFWVGEVRGKYSCIWEYTTNKYTIYSGEYAHELHWKSLPKHNSNTFRSRWDVTKEALTNLLDKLENVNLGLMRFDSVNSEGGYVGVSVNDVKTSKVNITSKLNDYGPGGSTPLSETFYEAYRYYTGQSPEFDAGTRKQGVASAFDGTSYKSPFATCQKNSIILFTDGEPTSDTSANSDIQTLVSEDHLSTEAKAAFDKENLEDDCSGSGGCMDELAFYLNNVNQTPTKGEQFISTYTIGGFGLEDGIELLKSTAKQGGGQFLSADNASELSTVLSTIFQRIQDSSTTFTSPSVTVSAFNSTHHDQYTYYTVFQPTQNARWQGNLKKYRFTEVGDSYPKTVYVSGKNSSTHAIDSDGFFKDNTKDYWNSGDPDGKKVSLGGFANLMNPTARNLFTNLTTPTVPSYNSTPTNTHSGLDLTTLSSVDSQHKTLYGWPNDTTDADFDKFHRWARGFNVNKDTDTVKTTEAHNYIGDPIHTEPQVVSYGGSQTNPDTTVFFGTNLGVLYAVDGNTGAEKFAFAPQELLPNLKTYYENPEINNETKPYGMDGPITYWRNDADQDGTIEPSVAEGEAKEHVYVYAGLRRGGDYFYGLDATDRSSPKLRFTLEGGASATANDRETDYARLAQTWSKPVLTKIRWGSQAEGNKGNRHRLVLFMGGGYDTVNDDTNELAKSTKQMGNAVYMIDAKTGQRLWWASSDALKNNGLEIDEMKYSIPAEINVIDIDGDKYADYLYVADIKGQIFRIDINPPADTVNAENFAKGGRIANFVGHRFFNRPTVSPVKDANNGYYHYIALGSGNRSNPLNVNTNEKIFAFKDGAMFKAPSSYTTLTLSDLYDITGNPLDSENETTKKEAEKAFKDKKGWYLKLKGTGEKITSAGRIHQRKIYINSYIPPVSASSPDAETKDASCVPSGSGKQYVLDVIKGIVKEDRDLTTGGSIPNTPVIYRGTDGTSQVISGTDFKPQIEPEECEGENCTVPPPKDCNKLGLCDVFPLYWRDNQKMTPTISTGDI